MLTIIYTVVIIVPLLLAVAYLTLGERKLMDAVRMRIGSYVVKLAGILGIFVVRKNIIPILALSLSLMAWVIILLDFGAIFAGSIPVAMAQEQLTTLCFTLEQKTQLAKIANDIIVSMNASSYFIEGTSLLRALRGNCFETVQSIVIRSYPTLHECAMAHIRAGTVFDPVLFLESNPIPTTGRLAHVSYENMLKICNGYSSMLTKQMEIISIFENGGSPKPELVKDFLTNSSYLDYFLKHVKSPIWEQIELAKQKLNSGTTIWPPKSKF